MENYSRPKAGVFAVRQGQPLFNNLQSIILGNNLKYYSPQKFYLGLIGTGNQKAIASWGRLGLEAAWLWKLKDAIDRKFMDRFKEFSGMKYVIKNSKKNKKLNNNNFMPCDGCGSQVGSSILERTLKRLNIEQNSEIFIGLHTPDDAAMIDMSQEKLLVETIDYLPSFVSDPFIFGQITTNHCLSNLWAMGAKPHTVSALVTLPYGVDSILEEILDQLLQGCLKILHENPVYLTGVHTLQGEILGFG